MTEDDETGGYKFALALLAASGSILYLIYNYIQNTAIHLHSYYLICLMITGAAISLIGFLAYLFIKGYSSSIAKKLRGHLRKYAEPVYEDFPKLKNHLDGEMNVDTFNQVLTFFDQQ